MKKLLGCYKNVRWNFRAQPRGRGCIFLSQLGHKKIESKIGDDIAYLLLTSH